MTAVDLMKLELARLHKSYDKVLDELTPEQLHRVPAGHPKANTIAWGVWHYVRTEDNVVRYILQNRRPIVWAEGGYADKLGLPPFSTNARPTGLNPLSNAARRDCAVATSISASLVVTKSVIPLVSGRPALLSGRSRKFALVTSVVTTSP